MPCSNFELLVEKLLADLHTKIEFKAIFSPTHKWPRSFSGVIGECIIAIFKRIQPHQVNEELLQMFRGFNPCLTQYLIRKTKTPKWALEAIARSRLTLLRTGTIPRIDRNIIFKIMKIFSRCGQLCLQVLLSS